MTLSQHALLEGEVVSKIITRCPFYGMSLLPMMGGLIDTQGNQCALRTENHSPCHMEIIGNSPDWNKCEHRTMEKDKKFSEFMENGRAFPIKFQPKGVSGWNGISMAAWFEHVMGRGHRHS
ncbi:MAG: hypothetical protein AAB507_00940 [Patescibacteria group bacterium]